LEVTALPALKDPSALEVATWAGTPAEVAEAFSSTMDSLIFADAQTSRAYVLTSPDLGDGKTTTATNLAIAFARIGRRVVLVDGDMRKPRIHDIFGIDPAGGLSDILRNKQSVDALPSSEIVRQTAIPNLFVVPTAPAGDVTTLLHSANLAELIKRLKSEFHVVVIDSPPMMNLSDARVLGWLSDGVLMVLRAGKTTHEEAIFTQTCLREDGIELLGTVLNDWNPRRKPGYASYGAYLRKL
jgi:capsular exopolysaccharide synthesis family protein